MIPGGVQFITYDYSDRRRSRALELCEREKAQKMLRACYKQIPSRRRLAVAMGVPYSTVNHWFSRDYRMSFNSFITIQDYYRKALSSNG